MPIDRLADLTSPQLAPRLVVKVGSALLDAVLAYLPERATSGQEYDAIDEGEPEEPWSPV